MTNLISTVDGSMLLVDSTVELLTLKETSCVLYSFPEYLNA